MADEQGTFGAAGARPRDPHGIGAEYATLNARLVRFLGALVGDAAEDVASQVWLEVVAGAEGFAAGEDGLRPLVFAIARRRVVDHRRRWWQRRVSPTAHDHPVWERATAAVDDAAADGAQAAAALIARLPRAQAEVVLLRVVGGLSGEEVARITGRSEGAVRVIQHRALRRLRREFGAGPEAV